LLLLLLLLGLLSLGCLECVCHLLLVGAACPLRQHIHKATQTTCGSSRCRVSYCKGWMLGKNKQHDLPQVACTGNV
jgi:hypothetical protein